jgi:hypothetical protein
MAVKMAKNGTSSVFFKKNFGHPKPFFSTGGFIEQNSQLIST